MKSFYRCAACLLFMLCYNHSPGQTLYGSYGPQVAMAPQNLNLTQDANTTFLVTLTSVKTNADYALGNPALTVSTNLFVSNSGYLGGIGFNTVVNFPTNAWTIEMIVSVPYAVSSQVDLLGWTNSSPFFYCDMFFGSGGVETILNYPVTFNAVGASGGNGQNIQNNGVDRWIYLAFACDFVNHLVAAVARDTNGDLLNKNIQFAPDSVVSGVDWTNGLQYFAQTMPGFLILGSSNNTVTVQALRISNIYRTNSFQLTPLAPASNSTNWLPAQVDPVHATNQMVFRTVGYPGYQNYTTLPVTENYLPMPPGGYGISLTLTNVPIGLYTMYLYGQIALNGRTNLNQVWKPCMVNFTATDAGGTLLASGQMPVKEYISPYRQTGFQFHLDSNTTNVTLFFYAPTNSVETPWIQRFSLLDDLAGLTNIAIKSSVNILANFGGATNQDTSLTTNRMQRDDMIWSTLNILNLPIEYDIFPAAFVSPPTNAVTHTWVINAYNGVPAYQWSTNTFAPLDWLDTNNSTIFYATNILSTNAWPSPYPELPTGVFFSQSNYPSLAMDIYNINRAGLMATRVSLFLGAIIDPQGVIYGANLPGQYFTNGIVDVGHDAAMALVRWAYDWPALEGNISEIRYCLASPDLDFGQYSDGEFGGNGDGDVKLQGSQDAFFAAQLFNSYDQLFPYIQGNTNFANAVHRKIPWINTPQDVIAFLDRFLVWSTVRDVNKNLLDQSAGLLQAAGTVLGPSPYSASLFDLTHQTAVVYPGVLGTFQEQYGTSLPRSGSQYIGSFEVYALGAAISTINVANAIQSAKASGIPVPMDLSNILKYTKIKKAGDFLVDMWVAGGFPFMIGDSSGGPHSSIKATNTLTAATTVIGIKQAFSLDDDPRLGWLLLNYLGITNNYLIGVSKNYRTDPILHNISRVVPDWGAILEMEPAESNLTNKTSATIRLGIGSGHNHNDYLDLNIFAYGLPAAVDLAARNEGNTTWSRPGANWAFLHNHAISSTNVTADPNGAGGQTGEPWLVAFAPPLVRSSYVDSWLTNLLLRDTMLMEVGTGSEVFYAFDVQWLYNSFYHTWCFHGCESSNLALNVPMVAQTNRWLDRLNDNSQYVSTITTNMLQATWTMTRQTNGIPYSFEGSGVLATVNAEQAVLGNLYNTNLPPFNVRATLLGRSNDVIMQGNPFSAFYQYCYPFLWTQTSNEAVSVYPAVYEWYRGAATVISNAVILQNNPLQVEVTTTSGQVDDYEVATNYFQAVSRDSQGVRWAKLSGYKNVSVSGLSITPATNYDAVILTMDHLGRTLTTSMPIPTNALVTAGNSGRMITLQLTGSNTNFSWADDLLEQEGLISSIHISSSNTLIISSLQTQLYDGEGNRNTSAMTVATEDDLWHFRNGVPVKSPAGVPLTVNVFTDFNNDGLIDMKTYDIGVGDHIYLPVDITIQRLNQSWKILSNVAFTGAANNTTLNVTASPVWQIFDSQGNILSSDVPKLKLTPH